MNLLLQSQQVIFGRSSVELDVDELPIDVKPSVLIIGLAVAFILTIIIFCTLVQKKKAPRNGFLRWLREYLNFRSIMISAIIKFAFLFFSILITIYGIIVMFSGEEDLVLPMIGAGLLTIIFGNIFLRLIMEMMMIMIGLWENTSDIRAVLVKDEETPEEKVKKEEKTPEKKPEEATKGTEIAAENPTK